MQVAGRVMRFGGVAAVLAWMAVAVNCSGSPTGPGPVTLAVHCPAPVQVFSPDGVQAVVSFAPTTTGGTLPTTVTCSPASGSTFLIGTTSVACTAHDSGTQTASCTFGVTVNRPPNDVPVITGLTLSAPRVDVNTQVQATATVTDSDTPPAQLQYNWTADRGGAFSGQGASVSWTAPSESTTPVDARLTVTVVEPYQVPGGATGENRVSKTSDPIHVHDSVAEISSLVMTFLGDFANSNVSAAYCVRNFSDSCPGKAEEQGQIADNRKEYDILSSSFRVQSVNIVTPFSWAQWIVAPCSFTSKVISGTYTGTIEKVTGNCLLTAKFEQEQWRLCDSHFQGVSVPPSMRNFFGRGWAGVSQ